MVNYPSQGTEIDNDYHPVDSDMSATNDHWGTKLAGDVVSLPSTGRGGGHNIDAPAYATGAAKDPKVLSIGMPTLKAWSDRKQGK